MKLVSDTVDKMKQESKPALSEQELITKLQNFTKQIPTLDTNHDSYLSVDELADGVRDNKLTPENKQIAAVIAQNIEIMSQLSATGDHYGTRINAADLATAHSIFEKPNSGTVIGRNIYIGGTAITGGVFGCVAGGAIGIFGGPPGMIAGCAIGGAIAGGGTGYAVSRTVPRPDPLGEKLGREPVKHLRTDLSFLR
jgi:hypothetical protein